MLARFRYKEMITVSIGENIGDVHEFGVHKNLVCHYSAFFTAACTGQSREATSGEVKLPKGGAENFDFFVQWLYTPKLDGILTKTKLPFWTTIIELYVLADKLQIPALKNAILDELMSRADYAVVFACFRENFPTNADICAAYANTPPT